MIFGHKIQQLKKRNKFLALTRKTALKKLNFVKKHNFFLQKKTLSNKTQNN